MYSELFHNSCAGKTYRLRDPASSANKKCVRRRLLHEVIPGSKVQVSIFPLQVERSKFSGSNIKPKDDSEGGHYVRLAF